MFFIELTFGIYHFRLYPNPKFYIVLLASFTKEWRDHLEAFLCLLPNHQVPASSLFLGYLFPEPAIIQKKDIHSQILCISQRAR